MEAVFTKEGSSKQVLEAEANSLRHSSNLEKMELVGQIDTLKSDNEQIKKKLVKLIRDKDNLWQRTDQLVEEQSQKATDRWQDNGLVTHCPQCNTGFSLFVRKHHCRMLGGSIAGNAPTIGWTLHTALRRPECAYRAMTDTPTWMPCDSPCQPP